MTQFKIKVVDIETLPQFRKLHPADQGRLMEFDQSTRFALERLVQGIFSDSNYIQEYPARAQELEQIMQFILSCPKALAINHMEALKAILFSTCAVHFGPFYFMYDTFVSRSLKMLRGYLNQYDVIMEETGFGY